MPFTPLDNHRNPDGTLDWSSYRKAQLANGEVCIKCGDFIVLGNGHPTECYACQEMAKSKDKVTHKELVRCPACTKTFNPYNDEQYNLLQEGEHDATCPHCDHDFTVSTVVEYHLTSPALEAKDEHD